MTVEKVKSRKVNGYVKAVLLRDKLAKKLANAQAEVTVREGGLKGGQLAEASKILNAVQDDETTSSGVWTKPDEGGES